MKGHQSLGESLRAGEAGEYDWIETRLRSRDSDPSLPSFDENTGLYEESNPLRTGLFAVALSGLAGLLGYFSFLVWSGGGRSIFLATATLAVFLACGAAAARRRLLLRFVLFLCSLCTFGLLVDQLVYYQWHAQVDRLVTTLQQGIQSGSPALPNPMNVRPTSFAIGPDQEVLLTFEPPLLAWTYHLDSASSLGHALVAGWYGILSRATQGRRLNRVARTIVRPHEVYSVGVKSGDQTLVCQEGGTGRWTLSIDTRPGTRKM